MEQNKLLELQLKTLENTFFAKHNEYRFITTGFGFVDSFAKMESGLFKVNQPYRLREGRIGLIKKGEAHIQANLIRSEIHENDLLLLTPNSIVQFESFSPDFDMQMIAIDKDFIQTILKDDFFKLFLRKQRNIIIKLNTKEQVQFGQFFALIWNILQEPVFHKEVIQHILVGILFHIDYILSSSNQTLSSPVNRQEELFRRFISLVNAHSNTERNVQFYADKLCLTPRYLNTVIKQVSQQTVMEWINQAITLEAKIQLKHSDRLVYEISENLNFPNSSFFCKFFKRMTGMTPQEYQKIG